MRYGSPTSKLIDLSLFLNEWDHMLDLLKDNLISTHASMKNPAGKDQPDIGFEVDDCLLRRLRPYRIRPAAKHFNEKLSPQDSEAKLHFGECGTSCLQTCHCVQPSTFLTQEGTG